MVVDRSMIVLAMCATPVVLVCTPVALADEPSWNGRYAITFMVGPKSGTSMAAGDPESQHTDIYGFESKCTNGKCVATIVSGPPPSNPTVPEPIQFTWDGTAWTQTNEFQWDCMLPDTMIEWNPAKAEVRYTPQPDGSLDGVMHTDILSGTCQGTIDIQMKAERV
jgi:hypothetical protein